MKGDSTRTLDRARDEERQADAAAAARQPRRGPHDHGGDERERAEDHQVVGAQRLQDEPRGQQRSITHAPAIEDAVQAVEHQGQELHVLRLQVRKSGEHVRVERVEHAADDARGQAAGPVPREQAHREARQGHAQHEKEVVHQHRRGAAPKQRRAHHGLHDHVLRVGQRVVLRIEDGRLEEAQGRPRQDMRHPRDRPRVERRIIVVEAGEMAGVAGQRPGMQHGERGEEQRYRGQPTISKSQMSPSLESGRR